MKDINLKKEKIYSLCGYVLNVLSGEYNVELEMPEVADNLYIRPDFPNGDTCDWSNAAWTVYTKDNNGCILKKQGYSLSMTDLRLADLIECGKDYLESWANEIYDDFVGD